MKIRNSLALLAFAAAAVSLAACQEKLPEPVVKGLVSLDGDAQISKQAVNNTTAALKKLKESNDTDLKARYATFSASVEALKEKVGGTRVVADITANKVDNYFKSWEDQITKLQDDDLRAGGEKRRTEALASYNELKGQITDVRAAYATYIAGVNDVDAYLKKDLTPAGLKTVTPTIDKTLEADKKLIEKFDKATDTIKKLTK